MIKQTRDIKLIVSPQGMLRKHRFGQPIPVGWTIIRDDAVFYYGELRDCFNHIPFLKESDYGKYQRKDA